MKKIIPVFCLALLITQTSCGPAAESSDTMHSRAKVIADSIAGLIKTSMAEAEAPGPVAAPVTPTAAPAPTPQGTANTK